MLCVLLSLYIYKNRQRVIVSNFVSLTSNKNIWPWHFFSLLPWFYYLWHSTAEDRGVCIFKCSLPMKLTANFSLTGSLFCIRALYQQNSLPRIHSSLLQLIATYSFINLDTVTHLARFLAKRNLCISLCIKLLCSQSCRQYTRVCTGKISWASQEQEM